MRASRSAVVDRDHQVVRTTGGVYVAPGHWASVSVHAFRRWLTDATVVTWCGLEVDVQAGGALTTDLITCLSCGQASWLATRENIQ